ncbi:MAG: hypothetical protein M1840_002433 [Geoglossum simile]|nr:MAG: hypothetical protein M1840_002433 [Geoglossum simile]
MSVTIHLDRLSTGPNLTPDLLRKPSDSSRVIFRSINDRWEENLDEGGDVSLSQFEASSDALRWHKVHDVRGQNEPTISTGVHLSLLEGLSKESITYFGKSPFDTSKEFFHNHSLDYLPSGQPEPTPNCFFFKWPRRVLQESELWDRETRIRANKPYDSNTSADPEKLGLDHKRFQRHPRIYRPYDTLEPQLNNRTSPFPDPTSYPGCVRHAAHECCSFFYKKVDGRFIGVLVFDARRQHIITQRRYARRKLSNKRLLETVEDCFVDDPTTRERFIKELDRIGPVKVARDPKRVIKAIISKFIREDYLDILIHFRNALDYVDLAMSNDDILQDAIPNWRSLFGRWRKEFPQNKGFIFEILHHYKAPGKEPVLEVSEHAEDPGVTLWLEKEFSNIARDMEVVGKRAKLTFQALMSTMAIVESEKAIAQAETISKLTNLAFFFIPLTLSASVFGMNMVVSSRAMVQCRKSTNQIMSSLGMGPQTEDLELGCSVRRTFSGNLCGAFLARYF